MVRQLSLIPLLVLAASCTDSRSAVAQPSPISASRPGEAIAWGYVVGTDDRCIVGAVVAVLDSSIPLLIGSRVRQERCDADDGVGWHLGNVGSGTRLVLQATMAGYQPHTRELVPAGFAITFVLAPE